MNELETIKTEILTCTACADILTPHPIYQGNAHSKILQISQAPSKTVMETNKPFNDASGKKLKQEWYQIDDETFYDPDNFYIASIARCYPGRSKHGGDNPPPKCCAEWFLRRELACLKPKLIIVIGRHAAAWFFPKQSFSELVFKDCTYQGCPLYVLPHPSPLNRRWYLQHPTFKQERLPMIRAQLHQLLELDKAEK